MVLVNFEQGVFEYNGTNVLPFDTQFYIKGKIDKSIESVSITIKGQRKGLFAVSVSNANSWDRNTFNKDSEFFYVRMRSLPPNVRYTANLEIKRRLDDSNEHVKASKKIYIDAIKELFNDTPSECTDIDKWREKVINNIRDDNLSVTFPNNEGLFDPSVELCDNIPNLINDILALENKVFNPREEAIDNEDTENDIVGFKEIIEYQLEEIYNSKYDLSLLFKRVSESGWNKTSEPSYANFIMNLLSISTLDKEELNALVNASLNIKTINDTRNFDTTEISEIWESTKIKYKINNYNDLFEWSNSTLIHLYIIEKYLEEVDPHDGVLGITRSMILSLSELSEAANNIFKYLNELNGALIQFDLINARNQNLFKFTQLSVIELNNQTTIISDLKKGSKNYISSDIGLAVLRNEVDEGNFRLSSQIYYGANIYFRPVNRDVSLSNYPLFNSDYSIGGGALRYFMSQSWNRIKRGTSVTIGVTTSDIEVEGERRGLIANKGLLLGIGYHFFRRIKVSYGMMLFQKNNPNPLIDKYSIQGQSYFSASLDLDVFNLLGEIPKTLNLN